MGFNKPFYIIFGTNLLTKGPVEIAVFFAYFSVSQKRNIKWSPNRMIPSGESFLEQMQSRGLGVHVKETTRHPRSREARPPPWWAPRGSTGLLLSPIYTHIPRIHRRAPRKPSSTTATFCTHEIPSWGLFWSSAGGGIDHGGLLHQHHSLSDVV